MATKQKTLVDQVFDEIFQGLLAGKIELGSVLNEATLAEQFNVSRGPVREAMKALQGRGLVTKEPFLKARVVDLSVADMIQIFQLREAVEGMSARLATNILTTGQIDDLLRELEETRNGESGRVLDLHVRIAEASGNQRIRALLCDELYYLLRIYRVRAGAQPGRRGTAFEEHWQILRAMRAGDAELAESLMRAHIARATAGLQALLDAETALNRDSAPIRSAR